MKGEVQHQETPAATQAVPKSAFRKVLRSTLLSPLVCSVMASLGIFGGIASMFIGVVCVIVHAAVPGDSVFDKVATALLIAAIPAMLIGAIFMDEIEPKRS